MFHSVIIPYVMTLDGLETNYHNQYRKVCKLESRIEAYFQFKILKITLESLKMDGLRGALPGISTHESIQDEVTIDVSMEDVIKSNSNDLE